MSVGNVHRKCWAGTNPAHVSIQVSEVTDLSWEGNCWLPPLTANQPPQTACGSMRLQCPQLLFFELLTTPTTPAVSIFIEKAPLVSQHDPYSHDHTCRVPRQGLLGELHVLTPLLPDVSLTSEDGLMGVPLSGRVWWSKMSDTYHRVRELVITMFIFLIVLSLGRQLRYREYFCTDTFYGFALTNSELTCQIKYQFL